MINEEKPLNFLQEFPPPYERAQGPHNPDPHQKISRTNNIQISNPWPSGPRESLSVTRVYDQQRRTFRIAVCEERVRAADGDRAKRRAVGVLHLDRTTPGKQGRVCERSGMEESASEPKCSGDEQSRPIWVSAKKIISNQKYFLKSLLSYPKYFPAPLFSGFVLQVDFRELLSLRHNWGLMWV